VTFAVK